MATSVLRYIREAFEKRQYPVAMLVAESPDVIRLLQRKKNDFEMLYQFAQWDPASAPMGISSFEFLNSIGFISLRLLAIHAVQVTDADSKLIKRTWTAIAHYRRSNNALGIGRMLLK